MTLEKKKEVLHMASGAWLVWGWLLASENETVLEADENYGIDDVRTLASAVSNMLIAFLSDDEPTAEVTKIVADICSNYAEIVTCWLKICGNDKTVFPLIKELAPPDTDPGDYNLDDIREISFKVATGLKAWASEPESEEPKKCPFCGARAVMQGAEGYFGVQCRRTETCGATVFFEDVRRSEKGTLEYWQKRRPRRCVNDDKNLKREIFITSPDTDPELLKSMRPCPFCGGMTTAFCEASMSSKKRFGAIVCAGCGANVMFLSAEDRESENEVVDRWNRRSGEEE